jgi:hypothetical protein
MISALLMLLVACGSADKDSTVVDTAVQSA